MSEQEIKKLSVAAKELEAENMAWARFLYRQYKKKKLKESFLKQQDSVELK